MVVEHRVHWDISVNDAHAFVLAEPLHLQACRATQDLANNEQRSPRERPPDLVPCLGEEVQALVWPDEAEE